MEPETREQDLRKDRKLNVIDPQQPSNLNNVKRKRSLADNYVRFFYSVIKDFVS